MIYLRPPICLKQIHKKMLAAETVKVESKCKLEYLSILETTSHNCETKEFNLLNNVIEFNPL